MDVPTINLCIFEDNHFSRLLPLVWMRPVYFLRCGMTDLAEKIRHVRQSENIVYHCRDYLEETVSVTGVPVNRFEDDRYTFVNGRVLFAAKSLTELFATRNECLYCAGDTVVAAVLSPVNVKTVRSNAGKPLDFRKLFPDIAAKSVRADIIRYPWDLINKNKEYIKKDFRRLCNKARIEGTLYEGCSIVSRNKVFIGKGAKIYPGVVIDAQGGPVYIETGATVMANSYIEGPAYIGKDTVIKAGSKIYGGTSIGDISSIGGEVTSSIIHSHSNKQHDGFLGHSYLCQWVNLGADTTNSNLKNNYKNVRVTIGGEQVDTKSLFAGLYIGDHSKTGINTMFNTGSVVGVCANTFGGGFQPKYVPSFSWGGRHGFSEYRLEKAWETAQYVVSRKKMKLFVAFKRLFSYIHANTAEERAKFIHVDM